MKKHIKLIPFATVICSMLTVLISLPAFAQTTETAVPDNNKLEMERGQLYLKPMTKGEIDGTVFYSEEWQTGTVRFFNKQLAENYPIRLNLKDQEVLIKADDQVKVAPLDMVQSLEIEEKEGSSTVQFVNASTLEFADERPVGYLKVIAQGTHQAFEYYSIAIKPATYEPALDMGSKSDEIVKESTYYVEIDGKTMELPGRRRKALRLFGNKKDQLKDYVKDNRLSFRNGDEIAKIMNYYNSL